MQLPIRDRSRPYGWPQWTLWATLPVVLSLGFVTGMALATYLPPGDPVPQPPGGAATTSQELPSISSAGNIDSSWQIPTPPPAAPEPPLVPTPMPGEPVEGPAGQAPPATYLENIAAARAQNIREARSLLTREFGLHPDGFPIDYQQMRHSGLGTSLVGLITISHYPDWVTALTRDPNALSQWLQAAAERVEPATQNDRFHVAWAVVDVVKARPPGFASHEITPLEDGTFLVVRPLAATEDHIRSAIVMRSADSLTQTASGRPSSADTPWAIYAPVIRFDTTDLYRPPGLTGLKPRP